MYSAQRLISYIKTQKVPEKCHMRGKNPSSTKLTVRTEIRLKTSKKVFHLFISSLGAFELRLTLFYIDGIQIN